MPEIAVVIPCLNGATTVRDQLTAVVSQSVPGVSVEVLVCDNGSKDRSVEIAEEYANLGVRVVDASSAPGINVARNAGLAELSQSVELVLFCDVDDVVDPDWIQSFWTEFQNDSLLIAGQTLTMRTERQTHSNKRKGVNWGLNWYPWATGANFAVARQVIEDVGLFDESFRGGGDETDFCWRAQLAGYRLAFCPDAKVHYRARTGLAELFKQKAGYGESHVRLYQKHAQNGMPRKLGRATALSILRSALTTLWRRDPRPLTIALGFAYGRAKAAWRHRVLYL